MIDIDVSADHIIIRQGSHSQIVIRNISTPVSEWIGFWEDVQDMMDESLPLHAPPEAFKE